MPYEDGETSGAQTEGTCPQRIQVEVGQSSFEEPGSKMGRRNGGIKRVRLNVSHLDLTSDLR